MGKVVLDMSMSLDGVGAGPDPSAADLDYDPAALPEREGPGRMPVVDQTSPRRG